MALVDKAGKLVRFTIRPGNAAGNLELATLLDGVDASEVIADKAYDSNAIRLSLADNGIIAAIPPKSNRRIQYEYDKESYHTRHLAENLFADLKQFRAIATRYAKPGVRYAAFINLAAWVIETKDGVKRGMLLANCVQPQYVVAPQTESPCCNGDFQS